MRMPAGTEEELTKALLELFENDLPACLQWLNSPNKALGDVTPLDRILTDGSTKAVHTLVMQLSHGVIV